MNADVQQDIPTEMIIKPVARTQTKVKILQETITSPNADVQTQNMEPVSIRMECVAMDRWHGTEANIIPSIAKRAVVRACYTMQMQDLMDVAQNIICIYPMGIYKVQIRMLPPVVAYQAQRHQTAGLVVVGQQEIV